jgi:hypothetical protein
MRGPAPHHSDENRRPLADRAPTLQGSSLSLPASTVSVHGPPRLHFEPQKLQDIDFNADPDPAFNIFKKFN